MNDLRYPIGKYEPVTQATAAYVADCIETIAGLPEAMRNAVAGLDEEQLETPYRPDGWTVRQLVHHVGDSHLNSVIRFKWTLTEDTPTIKAYNEKDWAETDEVASTPLEVNLAFLEALHHKWVLLLKAMQPADWEKLLVHPESGKHLSLGYMLGLYAWHSKHHVAHITALREREGW